MEHKNPGEAQEDEIEIGEPLGEVTVSNPNGFDGIFFDGPGEDEVFIFYPGASIDPSAYSSIMTMLAERGVDGFVIKMPADMAVLGMNIGVNNGGWWGEGEIKFYMDGDREFPTICGTGTEDYFGGSYGFEVNHQYQEFCTPYMGFHAVFRPDGLYNTQQRFSMYRWHIMDPIRFESDLRVTIQDLGWRAYGKYLPLQDDISTVAYWYQTLPTAPFPQLPDRDYLEVI